MREYLRSHPCVDCGDTDIVVLEFDHRDPATKRGYVTQLAMRKPWHLVLEEIQKCDVRCANCHRLRTAAQFNWRKMQPQAPRDGKPVETMPAAGTIQLFLEPRTKICTGCGSERPIDEFPIKNKKTRNRSSRCRSCRSAYGKRHYRQNRSSYLKRAKTNRNHNRNRYRDWALNYLRSHPCVDCGESNPLLLEFDHRDSSTKLGDIGTMLMRSGWDALLAEVAKCDVRCANCHRRRTARQFGWSKLLAAS